jgi:hypothetical protein
MSRCSLAANDRGAIMVIAIFFAVFGVAILYLGIGAAETVMFRERLQDSADSAALSGAVTYARLMNLIVLINLVMAALMAVLVTLKIIESIAIVGMVIAAALAYFTGGGSLAAIPPLNALRANMHNIFEELKPTIYDILKNLNRVSSTVVDASGVASQLVVRDDILSNYSDVAAKGFTSPLNGTLPLEDDEFKKLCRHSGDLVGIIAVKPFEGIPGLDKVMGVMMKPLPALVEAMSDWFCGDGGYSVPDVEYEKGYPQPESGPACSAGNDEVPVERGQEDKATSKSCDAAQVQVAAAEPDAQGNCIEPCYANSPYEYAVAQARIACDPSTAGRMNSYSFQLQRFRVTYTWNNGVWVKGEPELVSSAVAETADPPCGNADQHPAIAQGYNLQVHSEPNDIGKVNPVCSTETTPALPEATTEKDEDGGVRTIPPEPVIYDYQEVKQLFKCWRQQKQPVSVNNERLENDGDGDERAPKRLTGDVILGSEKFQVRAMTFGNPAQRESSRLVRLGLWGKPDPGNPLEVLKQISGYTYAQSEYFYTGCGGADRDAWMWNMCWKARLRRFSPTSLDDDSDGESSSDSNPMADLGEACLLFGDREACLKFFGAIEGLSVPTLR